MLNQNIKEVYCIDCGRKYEIQDYAVGCERCKSINKNSSISINYNCDFNIYKEKRGMFKYTDYLPYKEFPTLGEGDTPILDSPDLVNILGLENIYLKNEFQNQQVLIKIE